MPFRIALQDCLSGVLFGIDALPDCVSSLPFRIALQDCLSGLPFRVGLQDCRLGLPFRISCQDRLFNFVLEGLKRVPCRDLKSTISVNIFFYGPPSTPKYKAEANRSPMKLFKDGTLFIPPRALQFFSFVLGGVGGRVRDHVSSPKDGTFQIPTRKRECAKIKTKRRNLFKEPGISFLEQTFVDRWSANSAARDDGSVANDVFRINVGWVCAN